MLGDLVVALFAIYGLGCGAVCGSGLWVRRAAHLPMWAIIAAALSWPYFLIVTRKDRDFDAKQRNAERNRRYD